MLNREKLLKEFKEKVQEDTPKYKTCIHLIENMQGYKVIGNRVGFYCTGEKRFGFVTYEDVNKMMFDAIGSGDVPEMNDKCVPVEAPYRVLVVVDMQKDFTTGALGNKECKEAISHAIDAVRTGNYGRIIATRDTHDTNYRSTLEGKNLPVEHCIKGTDGWQIYPTVDSICKEYDSSFKTINKETFGSVKLGEELQKICIEHPDAVIDFCGVCTGICVISNVAIAKAFCPENRVRVLSKACACVTPESNKTALEAMKTFQVELV